MRTWIEWFQRLSTLGCIKDVEEDGKEEVEEEVDGNELRLDDNKVVWSWTCAWVNRSLKTLYVWCCWCAVESDQSGHNPILISAE